MQQLSSSARCSADVLDCWRRAIQLALCSNNNNTRNSMALFVHHVLLPWRIKADSDHNRPFSIKSFFVYIFRTRTFFEKRIIYVYRCMYDSLYSHISTRTLHNMTWQVLYMAIFNSICLYIYTPPHQFSLYFSWNSVSKLFSKTFHYLQRYRSSQV